MIRSLVFAAGVLALAGCLTDDVEPDSQLAALSAGPSQGLVDFVNDETSTDMHRLDVECAIRSDSARNILAARPFATAEAIDDVRMVGPWTMRRLTNCAWLFGYMRGVGPRLSGSGTAVANGTMSSGEWDAAATMAVRVPVTKKRSIDGLLHVMTDDDRLYMALEVDEDITERMFRITVLFDDNGDGLADPGEDRIAAVWSPVSQSTRFSDAHVLARAQRASDTIASTVYDSAYGGTSEGAAATKSSSGATVLEMWHPLDSGDAKDLSVGPGSSTPFSFAIAALDGDWVEVRDWANLEVPGASGGVTETVPWSLPQNVIAMLAARADGHADPNVGYPMDLSEQTATTVDGVPVSYRVRFVQWIDPAGGIQLWVEFELDAAFAITSENAYI